MKIISLFDGISVGRQALKELKIDVDFYISSEIDKNAIKVSKSNHSDIWQCGDVRTINPLCHFDLLLAGSPCQGFSKAGYQKGFEDSRSNLFFEFLRIKNNLNPTWFLMENTLMDDYYINSISNKLGVYPLYINSSLFSAQNRERLYWTNIPVSKIIDKNIKLSSIIGNYDGIYVYPRGFNKGGVKSYKGKSPCITTSSWQHNFFINRNNKNEKFKPEHAEQLQTLPINYTNSVSENQRFKLLGNSWTCEVIKHILSSLKK